VAVPISNLIKEWPMDARAMDYLKLLASNTGSYIWLETDLQKPVLSLWTEDGHRLAVTNGQGETETDMSRDMLDDLVRHNYVEQDEDDGRIIFRITADGHALTRG
jgi:hypothetical protein